MSKQTTTIVLSEANRKWIQGEIAAGRYKNESALIDEIVESRRRKEAAREELRDILLVGEQSGPSREWTSEELMRHLKDRARADGLL